MAWNVHLFKNELKISSYGTIYHHEHGQLCQAEHFHDCKLYYPVRFISKKEAQAWIDKGTIANLQEDLNNLDVGFQTLCFVKKDK